MLPYTEGLALCSIFSTKLLYGSLRIFSEILTEFEALLLSTCFAVMQIKELSVFKNELLVDLNRGSITAEVSNRKVFSNASVSL